MFWIDEGMYLLQATIFFVNSVEVLKILQIFEVIVK
jgi:hypothetical protein